MRCDFSSRVCSGCHQRRATRTREKSRLPGVKNYSDKNMADLASRRIHHSRFHPRHSTGAWPSHSLPDISGILSTLLLLMPRELSSFSLPRTLTFKRNWRFAKAHRFAFHRLWEEQVPTIRKWTLTLLGHLKDMCSNRVMWISFS